MSGREPFSFSRIRENLIGAEAPEHLDNNDIANDRRTTVQMTREMTTTSGCHVTLVFPAKSREGVRRRVAEAFVASMEKGREA